MESWLVAIYQHSTAQAGLHVLLKQNGSDSAHTAARA